MQYVRRSTELPGESPDLPYLAQQDHASCLQIRFLSLDPYQSLPEALSVLPYSVQTSLPVSAQTSLDAGNTADTLSIQYLQFSLPRPSEAV